MGGIGMVRMDIGMRRRMKSVWLGWVGLGWKGGEEWKGREGKMGGKIKNGLEAGLGRTCV